MFDENSSDALFEYSFRFAHRGLQPGFNHRSELKLNASPVVGDVGMRSARVWCQLASGNQLEKPYVYLLDSADQRMVATPWHQHNLVAASSFSCPTFRRAHGTGISLATNMGHP